MVNIYPVGDVGVPSKETQLKSIDSFNSKGDAVSSGTKSNEKKNTLSTFNAIMTLSKSMFNAGVFSLPYAFKIGGLWMTLGFSILIAILNYYGAYILVKSSQHMAKKTGQASLDYGHFAKRLCETSNIKFLQRNSKAMMIFVEITILFYQLGMCAVAILFISENMDNLLGQHFAAYNDMDRKKIFATFTLFFLIVTNCFTNMRIVAFFAAVSSIFLIAGAAVIIQYTVRQPIQIENLPATAGLTDVLMMIGMLVYAYEGQTMVLPVENKVRHPEKFLAPAGILTITFGICSTFMIFIGFVGYAAFGDKTGQTMTVNMPQEDFYISVNICLMIQSLLGNGMAMYVIFDMFQHGFRTKFGSKFPKFPIKIADKLFRIFFVLVTYLMVIIIPELDVMCSLVGVTSGTMCALIFPPIFETIAFWDEWKEKLSPAIRSFKVTRNCLAVCLGILFILGGVYANIHQLIIDEEKQYTNHTLALL